jgi:hypothetical protein
LTYLMIAELSFVHPYKFLIFALYLHFPFSGEGYLHLLVYE